MRRKLLIVGVIVVLIIGGWSIVGRNGGGQQEVGAIMRGDVEEELILAGEVMATEHVALSFPLAGELARINVKEGDIVQKGQILMQLDSTSLWAAVQQADAAYRSAQASLDHVYDQVKGHDDDETFSQRELRTAAETAKDSAYFALVQARNNLGNASLVAPFSGVVSYIASDTPGISTSPTQVQVELLNPQTVYFTVFADQNEIYQIKEGQSVNIAFDAFPEEETVGTVRRVSLTPSNTEVGVVYPVEISLSTDTVGGQPLRIGMTGDASFVVNRKENVLFVPPQFLNRDPQGAYITVDNNQKVYVEVGIEGEDRIEIIGEVSEGATIYD